MVAAGYDAHHDSDDEPQEECDLFEKKKLNISEQYLEYLIENSICNYQQQLSRPIHEWSKFAAHPRLNSLQSNYFDIVQNKLRYSSFDAVFQPNDALAQMAMIAKRGERIEWILRDHQKLSDAQFKLFLQGILRVVQMKSGKRNTFYIMGKSNTGKSQLLASFAYSFFRNGIGCQSNNIRSGFPWNDCIVKRLLLIEEPQMNCDNNEDYKKIMGGELLRCDKKYAPSGEVPPTPVFMTSNQPVWHVVSTQQEAYRNRSYIFYFANPIPEGSNKVPIEKEDWLIILTKYWNTYNLASIAANYVPRTN